jgi:hypothetical protein|tara:strand:+ start:166 stop:279 length:114 start_codon:yes stop_codon:yes gene_type:complete
MFRTSVGGLEPMDVAFGRQDNKVMTHAALYNYVQNAR